MPCLLPTKRSPKRSQRRPMLNRKIRGQNQINLIHAARSGLYLKHERNTRTPTWKLTFAYLHIQNL